MKRGLIGSLIWANGIIAVTIVSGLPQAATAAEENNPFKSDCCQQINGTNYWVCIHDGCWFNFGEQCSTNSQCEHRSLEP